MNILELSESNILCMGYSNQYGMVGIEAHIVKEDEPIDNELWFLINTHRGSVQVPSKDVVELLVKGEYKGSIIFTEGEADPEMDVRYYTIDAIKGIARMADIKVTKVY